MRLVLLALNKSVNPSREAYGPIIEPSNSGSSDYSGFRSSVAACIPREGFNLALIFVQKIVIVGVKRGHGEHCTPPCQRVRKAPGIPPQC
jgi:hypothetical protein